MLSSSVTHSRNRLREDTIPRWGRQRNETAYLRKSEITHSVDFQQRTNIPSCERLRWTGMAFRQAGMALTPIFVKNRFNRMKLVYPRKNRTRRGVTCPLSWVRYSFEGSLGGKDVSLPRSRRKSRPSPIFAEHAPPRVPADRRACRRSPRTEAPERRRRKSAPPGRSSALLR